MMRGGCLAGRSETSEKRDLNLVRPSGGAIVLVVCVERWKCAVGGDVESKSATCVDDDRTKGLPSSVFVHFV